MYTVILLLLGISEIFSRFVDNKALPNSAHVADILECLNFEAQINLSHLICRYDVALEHALVISVSL